MPSGYSSVPRLYHWFNLEVLYARARFLSTGKYKIWGVSPKKEDLVGNPTALCLEKAWESPSVRRGFGLFCRKTRKNWKRWCRRAMALLAVWHNPWAH